MGKDVGKVRSGSKIGEGVASNSITKTSIDIID